MPVLTDTCSAQLCDRQVLQVSVQSGGIFSMGWQPIINYKNTNGNVINFFHTPIQLS